MEGIFAIEREDDVNNNSELIHEIQFSQLCSVTLRRLPQLKSFCHRVKTTSQLQLTSSTNDGEIISEDMIDIPKSLFNEKVVLPNLNSLVVRDCDNLKELFSSSMVNSFVQLQYLEISECSLLEEVVFMEELKEEERKDTQFPFLKEMTIRDCPNFKGFISNDKIGFPSLKAMDIWSCPKLKEFIFNDKVVFPNLETLRISFMSAEKIWHNQLPTMSSSFQNLNRLDVYFCDNLKELFPSSMVNSFVQLQYLEISNCSLLEEVVFMEELQEEERKDTQFPSLKEMKIEFCPNFKGFISNDKIGFPSLKEMEIQMRPKLKEFIFNDKVAVPNIEELSIWFMDNLEKIWHNQLVDDSFCKLKSLKVTHCKKLLNVFPSSICGSLLSSLESLEVSNCDSLEEIFDLRKSSIYDSLIMLSFASLQRLDVSKCGSLKNLFSASILAKEGVVMEEAPARFLFPKLTSFELFHLPQLRSFYPGKHKVEGPVLKTLELSDCGIHDTDEDGRMQQPFFPSLVEEEFPCLEELSLDGVQVTMLCQGQFLESLFDRLKILKVRHDESTVSPFGIIQRCQNLEELSLYYSSYEEIFPHREDQTQTKIKTLSLNHLNNLKYIWKQNPSTSFQHLTSLEVQSCHSLINIGTSSVAKSLVQLTEMSIGFCTKITEVIGYHGDVTEDEIIFRKLKSLELLYLTSLTSFYSWNFTLKFPSLETLTVQQCPNMKIFSQGDLTTEKLQIVKIDYKSLGLRPDFDLNTTIQQSYEKANSAKDNGASSRHHFEIDQESIQQSHEEAIQQPHKETNEDNSTTPRGSWG